MSAARRPQDLSAGEWACLLRAIAELLRARIIHAVRPARRIIATLRQPCLDQGQPRADLQRVGWALRAAAARVPWRSDCLIQSMAANRWLRRAGFRPAFHLGVKTGSEGQLLAHAWVEAEGNVITGGDDIAGYGLMIGEEN